MKRSQYSAEILAQASLEVARDPQIGNSDLASRAEEVIAAGEDPFHFVFLAIKNGRGIMERAERIRLGQTMNGKNQQSREYLTS